MLSLELQTNPVNWIITVVRLKSYSASEKETGVTSRGESQMMSVCSAFRVSTTDILYVECMELNPLPNVDDLRKNIYIYIHRVSQEECAILRESVPYVKLYRYNPKHLYPKLNGYGDNGQRKVGTSCISAFYTPTAVSRATPPSGHMTACRAYVG